MPRPETLPILRANGQNGQAKYEVRIKQLPRFYRISCLALTKRPALFLDHRVVIGPSEKRRKTIYGAKGVPLN
ncbi:MAG: hypothetical protein ABR956_06145 [Terracidiphilus sp.]|jgi:hypothetical protein